MPDREKGRANIDPREAERDPGREPDPDRAKRGAVWPRAENPEASCS